MRSPCDVASADAFKTACTGYTIFDLTNENLVGEVDEQTVLQHSGDVVHNPLQRSWVLDAVVHLSLIHI